METTQVVPTNGQALHKDQLVKLVPTLAPDDQAEPGHQHFRFKRRNQVLDLIPTVVLRSVPELQAGRQSHCRCPNYPAYDPEMA